MLTRRRHVLVSVLSLAAMPCLFAALALLVAGCGDSTPPRPTGPESLEPATVDKTAAAQIDAEARRELGGGKSEAKEWLKDDAHKTAMGDKAEVLKFVDDAYAAGAAEVVVASFNNEQAPTVATSLIVTLPDGPEARKKIFVVQAEFLKSIGSKFTPASDVGQKLLMLSLIQ